MVNIRHFEIEKRTYTGRHIIAFDIKTDDMVNRISPILHHQEDIALFLQQLRGDAARFRGAGFLDLTYFFGGTKDGMIVFCQTTLLGDEKRYGKWNTPWRHIYVNYPGDELADFIESVPFPNNENGAERAELAPEQIKAAKERTFPVATLKLDEYSYNGSETALERVNRILREYPNDAGPSLIEAVRHQMRIAIVQSGGRDWPTQASIYNDSYGNNHFSFAVRGGPDLDRHIINGGIIFRDYENEPPKYTIHT